MPTLPCWNQKPNPARVRRSSSASTSRCRRASSCSWPRPAPAVCCWKHPTCGAAIPGVLGLIGEAARVDRVNLMQTRTGPEGERLLVLMSEWTAAGIVSNAFGRSVCTCDERRLRSAYVTSCVPGAASVSTVAKAPAGRGCSDHSRRRGTDQGARADLRRRGVHRRGGVREHTPAARHRCGRACRARDRGGRDRRRTAPRATRR